VVINQLNPLLRGWGNYNRHVVSKEVFSYVDQEIFKALWRWAKRRHPNKGRRWIKAKYFKTLGNQDWIFADWVKGRREGEKKLISLIKLSEIQIIRHVKVKDTASPDDPSLTAYWRKRKTTEGKTFWSQGSAYYKVAENQNWKSPVCREHLMNGEQLHTHHIVAVKDGGDDRTDNLIHLHKGCHISQYGSVKGYAVLKTINTGGFIMIPVPLCLTCLDRNFETGFFTTLGLFLGTLSGRTWARISQVNNSKKGKLVWL